ADGIRRRREGERGRTARARFAGRPSPCVCYRPARARATRRRDLGRTERVLAVVAIALLIAAFAVRYVRRPSVSRVQRGWNVASTKGCFTCHGPGGIRGMADPGHGLD